MSRSVTQATGQADQVGGHWSVEAGPVRIDPVKMLRIHGYRDLDKVRPVIRKAADDVAAKAEGLMTPAVHARRIDVARYGARRLVLSDGTAFEGIDFESALEGARSIVVAVATIGRALDEAVIAAMDEFEPLEALFLETAGWLGVEGATRDFVRHLQNSVKPEKLRVTRRRGPGYTYKTGEHQAHWPLEQQREIFSLFADVELPITLLESCAMLPKMSRSGMYGLAPL